MDSVIKYRMSVIGDTKNILDLKYTISDPIPPCDSVEVPEEINCETIAYERVFNPVELTDTIILHMDFIDNDNLKDAVDSIFQAMGLDDDAMLGEWYGDNEKEEEEEDEEDGIVNDFGIVLPDEV